MRIDKLGVLILVLMTFSWGASRAGNLTEEEMQRRFELMQPAKCSKPKSKLPPLTRPTYYNKDGSFASQGARERFFFDLDGDGTCELIDIWIDRLTPLPNDNRLMNFSEIYQFKKGRWVYIYGAGKNFAPFDYVPKYQLRDKTTGRIYYLFNFKFDRFPYTSVRGAMYFDRWPTRQEEKERSGLENSNYGIRSCSYHEHICDGFDLGKIAEVLLKSMDPALSPADRAK